MIELDDATFEQLVREAERPVLVDFWAPWCGPCHAVAPVIEELAAEHGERIVFAKLNVDSSPGVSARYGILSIPTVILFENGEPVQTVVGARSREQFERAYAAWLDGSA